MADPVYSGPCVLLGQWVLLGFFMCFLLEPGLAIYFHWPDILLVSVLPA